MVKKKCVCEERKSRKAEQVAPLREMERTGSAADKSSWGKGKKEALESKADQDQSTFRGEGPMALRNAKIDGHRKTKKQVAQ